MSDTYVDKTGTLTKPNPMRDVFLEFPLAMMEISKVTAFGAIKHAPRGWQTFDPEYGLDYHRSKVGRHLLKEELEGPVNHEDGDLLHPAQTAWNMLAYLEHFLRKREAALLAQDATETFGPLLPEAEKPFSKCWQCYVPHLCEKERSCHR